VGLCLTPATACTFTGAAEVAQSGDQVLLDGRSGPYKITNGANVNAANVRIRPRDGHPRPRFVDAIPSADGFVLSFGGLDGGLVSDVRIDVTGQHPALLVGPGVAATADRIDVFSGGGGGSGLVVGGAGALRLSNSVVRTIGVGARAVESTGSALSDNGIALSGVTIDATGPDSVGLSVAGSCAQAIPRPARASAVDSIILGAARDIRVKGADCVGGNAPARASVSYSATTTAQVVQPFDSLVKGPGTRAVLPLFVKRSTGDLRQRPGSPTIDRGTTTGIFGSGLDIEGQARVQGARPDIGADESLDMRGPSIARLRLGARTFRAAARGASVAAKRRPVGSRVSVRLGENARLTFVVERRKGRRYKRVKGSFALAGHAGTTRFRFSGRLRGRKLAPGRYRLAVRARDAAGNRSRRLTAAFRIVR
jgi:hypothetical protein